MYVSVVVMVIRNCNQLQLGIHLPVMVMELFQSQSSCYGSWYSFAICIKLHNYHTTTVMDIVYICGYISPPKR